MAVERQRGLRQGAREAQREGARGRLAGTIHASSRAHTRERVLARLDLASYMAEAQGLPAALVQAERQIGEVIGLFKDPGGGELQAVATILRALAGAREQRALPVGANGAGTGAGRGAPTPPSTPYDDSQPENGSTTPSPQFPAEIIPPLAQSRADVPVDNLLQEPVTVTANPEVVVTGDTGMKASECRLCGAAHWNHEPHETKGVEVRAGIVEFMRGPVRVMPALERSRVEVPRPVVEAPVACLTCGVVLEKPLRGPAPKYCSSRCRTRAFRAAKA